MIEKKMNVAILFGGRSAEHEVSLQSAKNIFDAIDKKKFNPILIGIDKSGKWLLNDSAKFLLNADDPKLIKLNQAGESVALIPANNGEITNLDDSSTSQKIAVVFPILHGPFGEDGTAQGFLILANLPFVGPSILGSAVGMDKDVMKRLLCEAGLPIGKFVSLKLSDEIPDFTAIKSKIGLPFFVKPANMGSSVGIAKVHNESEYADAVKDAFNYDVKIIIEENIPGREIECAVLGNADTKASVPGEIKSTHEFYSYEAKYIDENGAVAEIPAKLPEETIKKIQELAVKTFQVLECEGCSRVDFFLKENGEVVVNEINTIPGFTKISMYPKLWEASGISYTKLITKLINLAIERFENERKLKTNYSG